MYLNSVSFNRNVRTRHAVVTREPNNLVLHNIKIVGLSADNLILDGFMLLLLLPLEALQRSVRVASCNF
jgi:hypothetical protein